MRYGTGDVMRRAKTQANEEDFGGKVSKKRKGFRYDKRIGLLLISPWLLGVLIFKLAPILASLVIAFTDFYFIHPEETQFIGMENFDRLIHAWCVARRSTRDSRLVYNICEQ